MSNGAGKSRASVRHYETAVFESTGRKRRKPPSAHYTIFVLPVYTKYKCHKKNNYMVMFLKIPRKFAQPLILKILFFCAICGANVSTSFSVSKEIAVSLANAISASPFSPHFYTGTERIKKILSALRSTVCNFHAFRSTCPRIS